MQKHEPIDWQKLKKLKVKEIIKDGAIEVLNEVLPSLVKGDTEDSNTKFRSANLQKVFEM